jgi:cytoskeletal protein CcmA (bactofilin family)
MIFKRFLNSNSENGSKPRSGPSILTQDLLVDGNINSAGELQIDGTVNGVVRARACMVDMQGVVHGEIIAEDVMVRGRVIGPIRGLRVHLFPGAHVEGDVITASIAIENGAYIYGSIRRSDDPLADFPSQTYEQPEPEMDRDPYLSLPQLRHNRQ